MTAGSRPNILAWLLTLAGVLILVLAKWFEADSYLLGVLINVGTTFLLFALLWFAGNNLIGRIAGPKNLLEANDAVEDSLAKLYRFKAMDSRKDEDPRRYADAIAEIIKSGPFEFHHAIEGDCGFVYSARGKYSGMICWTLLWSEPGCISHEVTIQGESRPLRRLTPLPTNNSRIGSAEHLQRAEEDTFALCCDIVRRVDRQTRSTARSTRVKMIAESLRRVVSQIRR